MKVWRALVGLFRRLRRARSEEGSHKPLREFVYLDDVSVYSLLASRRGGIATEFTESQTNSLNSSTGGELGIDAFGAKASFESTSRLGHVQTSQVLRKAIVQTSFKELYDIERASLALSPNIADEVPKVRFRSDLEGVLASPDRNMWVIDPGGMHRGELLEVEVELEADPIFRIASVVNTIQELVEDNEPIFGNQIASQLPQMRSVAKLLNGLLFGLVPIRARLVNYRSVLVAGREALVHLSVLDQLPPEQMPDTRPTFLVGVAQQHLFWKDIRQILFSQARHTTFCRLATSGLADSWNPAKVVDVLAGIIPRFDEIMSDFSQQVGSAMNQARDTSSLAGNGADSSTKVMKTYVELLLKHHHQQREPDAFDEFTSTILAEDGWLNSVDSRRKVFRELTERVDLVLGTTTSSDDAYQLRDETMRCTGIKGMATSQTAPVSQRESTPRHNQEGNVLDTEIIAIYW